MSALLRYLGLDLVCALVVLWAVERSGATQPQPSAGVGTALEPDQLLRLIVQRVKTNIQLITKLSSRIDRLDSRLTPRLNSIESRLNALDFKQDSFDAKLDSLDAKQDSFKTRLDDLASRVDSEDNRLNSRLEDLVSRVDIVNNSLHSTRDDLLSRVYFVNNSLHATRNELDSRLIPRLNNIESRLNAMDSKLDSLTSRVESEGNRLDARLDDLASRVDSVNSTLHATRNEVVSRVDFVNNSLHATRDELVSRANSTERRLDSKLYDLASQLNAANNGLDARLIHLVSRVDGLAERSDRLDGASFRLDGVSSRLDGFSYRSEELTNLTERLAQPPPPRDCSDLPAGSRSGIYLVQPDVERFRLPVKAYCDLESDGGRWTVIQRRADIQPRQSFNRSWSEYREGFGDLEAEFWWGLDNLWRLTGSENRQYELWVNLADFDGGRRHASYELFRVASGPDGYRLTVRDYTGDAGDSLGRHSGYRFSTYDRDQDTKGKGNCAAHFGGGWWFIKCYHSNLNGPYLAGKHDNRFGSVEWSKWRGYNYSLKETEMKIRPVDTE